jgi:hypothetical protein
MLFAAVLVRRGRSAALVGFERLLVEPCHRA